MPAAPTPQAAAAIALAVFAIVLFTRSRIRLESASLLILLVALIGFEILPLESEGRRVGAPDVLAGFGNEALVTIGALMMLAKGLETTGALQPIGHVLANLWSRRPLPAFGLTLLTVASLSLFLNNTPVVAAVLPLLVAVSLQTKMPASRVLMPVGFATIIGGMATTIGTSTNLLVVGIAADLGAAEFGLFDFAPPVFVVGSFALLYLWLVAPRLLPDRAPPLTDVAPRLFEAALHIHESSPVAGRTLGEALVRTKNRMSVRRVTRGAVSLVRLPSVVIRAGDRLHVRDTPEQLKAFEHLLGATLLAGDSEERVGPGHPLESEEQLAEVVVTRGSLLDQASLDSSRLSAVYDLTPLALHRAAEPARAAATLAREILEPGDVVLVQAPRAALDRLKRSGRVLLLDGRVTLPRTAKAPLALLIMGGVVLSAATGALAISVAALLGVGLMLLARCLTWRDALAALDRRIVMVIVASLALGLALTASGAAEYIALTYVAITDGLPVAVVLAGFILVVALLTEVVTNNALAVLGTPIAVAVAQALGVPAEPFVLGLLFGANMSYLTPIGYQTNLLVMSAGGYRFSDFFRAGLPLQLIMWIGLSVVLPLRYEL